jgi:hypothetical protein
VLSLADASGWDGMCCPSLTRRVGMGCVLSLADASGWDGVESVIPGGREFRFCEGALRYSGAWGFLYCRAKKQELALLSGVHLLITF